MAQVTDELLDKTATLVVDRFFNEKVALTDGVVEAAKQGNYNPEQIKRLVEAVNNMTFLKKFNGAEEGAPDRMVEFETADSNAAIQRLLDAAKDVMSSMGAGTGPSICCDPSHDHNEELGQDLPTSRPDAPPPLSPLEGEDISPAGEPKIRGTVMIMKLRKTASELQNKIYECRHELTDQFTKIASHFRKQSAEDFCSFEKDALCKWGSEAVPFLGALRQTLRLVPVVYDVNALTKTARIIDSTTPDMKKFSELLKMSDEIDTASKGLEKATAWLKELEA